jgi:selenide,water dikinase
MGGRPLTALNICCFPFGKIDPSALEQIVLGGLDKIREAGAVLLGGHTVRDEELKYGLSVSGAVHPNAVITNAGSREGDLLILTKPIGTGVLINAARTGLACEQDLREPLRLMATLNRVACEVMRNIGANACTDITGFGLAGHAMEIARASGVHLHIAFNAVPLYSRAFEYLCEQVKASRGSMDRALTREFYECDPDVALEQDKLLFDPQTSGGLLISVPRRNAYRMLDALHANGVNAAAIVGEVTSSRPVGLHVTPDFYM